MKRIPAKLKRQDGTPWYFDGVLFDAVDKIMEASEKGSGLYLTSEHVRALDWAVIRAEGEVETDLFRDMSYSQHVKNN